MAELGNRTRLSLERLDTVSLGLLGGHLPEQPDLIAAELLPFMEWSWLRAAGHALEGLDVARALVPLRTALRTQAELWVNEPSSSAGFIRVRRHHLDLDYANWIGFCRRFESGMRMANFSATLAKQITGALGELEDNIHWHSQAPRSGLLAFLATDHLFEFVVLDQGIGVLASLQQAEDFLYLRDDGAALEAAVAEGNSRFGRSSGRGYGFRDLFLGLANNRAHIRFRSGDHLLELDGTTGGDMSAKRAQRARGKGFMIGVRCIGP
jgi:hypothetical protein